MTTPRRVTGRETVNRIVTVTPATASGGKRKTLKTGEVYFGSSKKRKISPNIKRNIHFFKGKIRTFSMSANIKPGLSD